MLFFVSVALLSTPAHAAGEAPVAEAGLGLLARVDDTVVLNGTGSYDPEGDALTYTWTQVGGPPVELERADSPQPQFLVSSAGTFRFELVVGDGLTESGPDGTEVVVPYEAIDGVETGCAVVGARPARNALAVVVLMTAALLSRRRH